MKLLIIRHGDPDYEHDSLTENGWIEAGLLAERLKSLSIRAFYCSPLGRAQDTASITLEKTGRTAVTLPWLTEFHEFRICPPHQPDKPSIAWDWMPADWTKEPRFFEPDGWLDVPIFKEAGAKEAYEKVTAGLDTLLKENGYERDGYVYRAVAPSNDTIVFFCHFGVEMVLLSHLLNLPLMPLWHGMNALTSSVTTVITEERQPGIAYFRMNGFSDVSHLYAAGREPSFSGRFRECFTNDWERG